MIKNKGLIKILTATVLLSSLSAGSVTFAASAKTNDSQTTNQNNIIAGELLAGIKEDYSTGKRVTSFFIQNTKEKVEVLKYLTTQRYNFVVKDRDNKVVYDYSKNNMFAQVESEETVKQGETIEYKVDLESVTKDLKSGHYTLYFNSTAQGLENVTVNYEILIEKESEKSEIKQTKVTFIRLVDNNSIEVKGSKGKRTVYKIEAGLVSNFKNIKKNSKVTLWYTTVDGKNVVNKVEVKSKEDNGKKKKNKKKK